VRILITSHYWHPHRGGIETVAYEQALRFAKSGHHVTVVTSQLPGDSPLETTEGILVHRVPVWNGFAERWGIPYPVFHPRLVALLDRLIGSHDVVLAHGHVYLPSIISAFLCRRHGRPLILFQHNPFVRFRPPWNLVERVADRTVGAFSLRSAKRLLTQSRFTTSHVHELVPNRTIAILANGVDTKRFCPLPEGEDRQSLRRCLGLPVAGFLVLTIRRLVYRNGLDVLLNAASQLQGCKDIHFVIGGRGPERQLLERTIRERRLDHCHLVGPIGDELLPRYYQAADIFALPTRTGEGFGLVLLEAFASGLPVVASSGGGQDEVVVANETGLLVPPEDPAALANAINALHGNPLSRAAMGTRALSRARELTWEAQVEQLEDLVGAATGRRDVRRGANPS